MGVRSAKSNLASKLDVPREQHLEKLVVAWDAIGNQWERMFVLLEQFKDHEAH
jgi:hypothetical protein